MIRRCLPICGLVLVVLLAASIGCARRIVIDVNRATVPYPRALHSTESIDVQVFREGTRIEIVNSSTRPFADAYIWINQRFRADLASLPAGATVQMSLEEFFDVRGETFRAGGFFQTQSPSPVRLIEIQESEYAPLVGLVAIASRNEV